MTDRDATLRRRRGGKRPGAGAKPKAPEERWARVTVGLSPEDVARLDAARREGESRAEAAKRLIFEGHDAPH